MILARAPLRISLGGGGTDLPSYYSRHGGFVLSAAIDKYVYIYVNRPAADDLLRIKYSRYEQVSSVDEIQHDLVRPSLKALDLTGSLEIVSMADVPDGTGLGSSGSYLVALLTALYEFKRERVSTAALAELAVHIEMELAGHPVGKQDHYMACYGGLTCLEIDTAGKVRVSPLTMSLTDCEELRRNTLLFFTGLQRSSRHILQAQRDDTTRQDSVVIDSLHRTRELGYRIKEVLERGDLDKFGQLLDEHWQNKKRRSGAVTNASIDGWYAMARESGALGGKVIGAGGGGFLMLYCPGPNRARVRQTLESHGLREMPFDFDFSGAKTLVNF
jgi:D-glycero-alpha-D-manno-heptose-7-phosphate kinase